LPYCRLSRPGWAFSGRGMVLGQILAGVEVGLVEAILFPAISLVGIGLTIALLKNITEKVAGYNETLLFQK
jgi:hypothetical protein